MCVCVCTYLFGNNNNGSDPLYWPSVPRSDHLPLDGDLSHIVAFPLCVLKRNNLRYEYNYLSFFYFKVTYLGEYEINFLYPIFHFFIISQHNWIIFCSAGKKLFLCCTQVLFVVR